MGEQTWTDGAKYVGEFVNFEKEGKGKMLFANGAIYDGEWKNGQ